MNESEPNSVKEVYGSCSSDIVKRLQSRGCSLFVNKKDDKIRAIENVRNQGTVTDLIGDPHTYI